MQAQGETTVNCRSVQAAVQLIPRRTKVAVGNAYKWFLRYWHLNVDTLNAWSNAVSAALLSCVNHDGQRLVR